MSIKNGQENIRCHYEGEEKRPAKCTHDGEQQPAQWRRRENRRFHDHFFNTLNQKPYREQKTERSFNEEKQRKVMSIDVVPKKLIVVSA